MTYWMSKTYDDLAALCGHVGATERDFDWDIDTQPNFIKTNDFTQRLRYCLRAREDLVERYGTDCGFDALAWDAYFEHNLEDYGLRLYRDSMPLVTPDMYHDALAIIRTLMTASQNDPEVQALRRAAEANWKGSVRY